MAVPPARIGPYELVSSLGVGGMAETYLAVRRGPGGFEQRVCLKRVRHDLGGDPEFVRQFLAEAAIAAKLRHTAIAQVLDFGRDGDDYYMALELVDGLDLRALLEAAGGGLPPDISLHIAVELATALDFAHRAGGDATATPIIHRDVSASNVLVSVEGEVKLADFGIARSLSGPQHTQTGVVKGKVPYLAPEYARSGRFDARCDLFSLGVLLYEVACGVRPHDGATDLETLERAMTGTHAALTTRVPDFPPAFADMIEQLIEPDPELRFESAGALLEALLGLPAGGRARRELATLVGGIRRAQAAAAPLAVEAPLERTLAMQDATPSAHAAAPDEALVASNRKRSRGPLVALAIALAFAGAVLALFITRGTRDDAQRAAPTSPSAAIDRASVATAIQPTSSAPGPAAAEIVQRPSAVSSTPAPAGADSEPESAPPNRKRSARARLEIVVMPYGEVFVDGKHIGPAPVTVALAAGEHDISAKQRDGTLTRRITLTAGQHHQLVLR